MRRICERNKSGTFVVLNAFVVKKPYPTSPSAFTCA